MKNLLISIILFLSVLANAEPIKVVLLDTGINTKSSFNICPTGSKSFVGDDGINDNHSHGTIMASVIKDQAKDAKFCFIVVKYYEKNYPNIEQNFVNALEYISTLKVDIVNISAGGPGFNVNEKKYIDKILRSGAKIVAAAGNEGRNLDLCDFYPACYNKDIIVVGGRDFKQSNYGKVVDYLAPYKVFTLEGKLISMGTSVSAAYITGTMIKILNKERFNQ